MSAPVLLLDPLTARELMSSQLISVRALATVGEATALLTDRGFSAAPVIDEAGRPVGVVSRADILVHDREALRLPPKVVEDDAVPEGFHVEAGDPTQVGDIMTPVVFSVPLDASAEQVVGQMLTLHVHQMFVVDDGGALVGVISTLDVLRRLRRARAGEPAR